LVQLKCRDINNWKLRASLARLALPTQMNSAPVIVAQAQGLRQAAGVNVVTQPFVLGKEALKSAIDGNAFLAVAADTPSMFALLGGKDVAKVAGISQARRSLAIVARDDSAIGKVVDLSVKSLALTSCPTLACPTATDGMMEPLRAFKSAPAVVVLCCRELTPDQQSQVQRVLLKWPNCATDLLELKRALAGPA
jgi:hypothetical protein